MTKTMIEKNIRRIDEAVLEAHLIIRELTVLKDQIERGKEIRLVEK